MKNLHSHGYYELYYLTSGKRKYFLDNALYQLEEGNLLLIPPNVLHRSISMEKSNYSRILVNLPATYPEDKVISDYLNKSIPGIINIPSKRRGYFEGLLQKLESESLKSDEYSEYLIRYYINEIVIFINRIVSGAQAPTIINQSDYIINNASKYIKDNFDKAISLEAVADSVGMSKTYFSKLFRKKTGFGFSDYLTSVRMSEAAKLLNNTNLAVTEIALKCGYNDSAYFTATFRKHNGISPLKYRNSTKM
jgi:AraC-like DNA-binding protein